MTIWMGRDSRAEGRARGILSRKRYEYLVDTEHCRLGEGHFASYTDSSRS